MSGRRNVRAGCRVRWEPLEGRQLLCSGAMIDTMGLWGQETAGLRPAVGAPGPVVEAQAATPIVASVGVAADPVGPNGMPLLNSVPGAPTAVYLDFDGYVTTNQNTLPYDTDGNPAVFGVSEQADIREAWRHVASYFSMFNTNVTTVVPSVPYSWSMISNSITGVGFSYLQFNVNNPGSYNPSGDARSRQSGIAHEVGHNFGLQHQSDYDLLGEKIREYSSGYDNLHGPIMGVDYAQSIHKWFTGHPSNSPSILQDDVAAIAAKIRSFPNGGDGMRPDDVPNAITSARVLTASAGVYSATGTIERIADADAYAFVSTGAQMRVDLVPPNPSMLDAKLELYAADGTLIAGADGSTNDQHLTISLPAGTFYAVVRSHGDYGDLGLYDMTIRTVGALPSDPVYNALPAPGDVVLTRGLGTNLNVTWSAVAGATGYSVERSSDGALWSSAGTTSGPDATSLADPAVLNGGRRYFYRVSAMDDTGRSAPSAVVSTITRPNAVSSLTLTSWRPDAVILNWRDVSGDTGYRIERQTDATANTWATVGTVGANVPSYTATGLPAGTSQRFRVTALNPGGESRATEVTGTTRLPAVAGLTFTTKQSNRMAFRWNALASAATYRVQRSTNNVDWDTVATISGTTYEDNTVQPVREYYYRVVGLNGASQGLLGTTIFAASPATTVLPAGWTDRDIGTVGGSGTTSFAGGSYTVLASGSDIWDPADAFRFTYQPLVGDGEIIARLAQQEPTWEWAKAGVMIRENLSPGSRHAMMVITPDNGSAFQWRATSGGPSSNNNTAGPFAPYWVKLVRQGATLIGYRSTNGTAWTEQARATIPMAQSVFIGLAAASGDNSELGSATFTNVTLSNRAPTITSAASATPAPVTGNTTALSVLGADDHGEVNLRYNWSAEQVPDGARAPDFSVNNVNAAKSATATFFQGGTYVLRVTATDLSGLVATSAVTVQVVTTATAIRVLPAEPRVAPRQTLQLSAAVLDQFGLPVVPAPAVTWDASDGQIDQTGRFTAPALPGQYLVAAMWGNFTQIVTVDVVADDVTAPTMVSAASSKVHGGVRAFDLPVLLDGPAPSVEPRQGGATTLRLTFSEPLLAADGTLDASEFALTNATFASATVDNSGGLFVLTLNLAGVIDGGVVAVALGGLTDLAGNTLAGDRDFSVRSLFGDIDGSGVVNNHDVLAVRAGLFSSLPVSGAWDYLLDLDLSGSVNSRDVLLARTTAARALASVR